MHRPLLRALLFTLLASSLHAQTPLAQAITTILSAPPVAHVHWGIAVSTLDGTPIYTLNDDQLFQPASTAKLFTTAAAMHLLGPGYTVTTLLDAPAPNSDTIHGDLILRGAGDPSFASVNTPYIEPTARTHTSSPSTLPQLDLFANQLLSSGIRHITGDIIGDDTLYPWQPYPDDWATDDLLWGYGAPISALSLRDNTLRLTITPAARAGDPATVTLLPDIPFYDLQATVSTTAHKTQSSVQVQRIPNTRTIRVWGAIALGSGTDLEELAIDDPAEYAATALQQILIAHGIRIDGRARAQHRLPAEIKSFRTQANEPLPSLPLAATSASFTTSTPTPPLRIGRVSPTLAEDIVATNKDSLNLHAELFLLALGKQYGADGTQAQGARVVRQFLLHAGLAPYDFVFFDGSGLSGHDLVTPRATVRLLTYAPTQPWFELWRASLPIGGVDGTLEHRFTKPPLKGNVIAKTGTLGESRALSGYITCASGRTVAFTIMAGNHLPSTNADREAIDQIVAAIAAAN